MLADSWLNWFTVVVGFATLVSFALQIKPIFPQYQRAISKALYILVGTFAGSIIGGLKVESISIDVGGSAVGLLVVLVQAATALLGIYFLIKQVNTKEDHEGSIAASFGIFLLLFVYHLGTALPNVTSSEDKVTLQEWSVLAANAEDSKQYDRAIWLYERVRGKLSDSKQRNMITTKIKDLTAKSAGLK